LQYNAAIFFYNIIVTTTINITTSSPTSATIVSADNITPTPTPTITPTTTHPPTDTTTASTYSNYVFCDNNSEICWALVGIGSVIAAILLIAVITCVIFTATVAKGTNILIRYLSNSAGVNGERDIQPPQLQPQNEGILQYIYTV
jgi:hypothetical protein